MSRNQFLLPHQLFSELIRFNRKFVGSQGYRIQCFCSTDSHSITAYDTSTHISANVFELFCGSVFLTSCQAAAAFRLCRPLRWYRPGHTLGCWESGFRHVSSNILTLYHKWSPQACSLLGTTFNFFFYSRNTSTLKSKTITTYRQFFDFL